MAFPVSPTNGQTAVVNNITYQFSNVGNTWTRLGSTANTITANIITANTLNINTLISVTGNVTGNYILGNGALLTGITTNPSNISSGTSNVTVVSSGGNVTVGVGGTGNVAVFATTGEYITGLVSVSGNVTGGNLLTAGAISATGTLSVTGNTTLSTTSTGNLSAGNVTTGGIVSATANITGGNIRTAGIISATGTITSNGATNSTAFAVGNSAVSNVALGMFPTAGTSGEYAIRDYSNVFSHMYLDVGMGGTANGAFRFRTTNAFTTLANINSTGITTPLAISATGNVTGNYFIGNGSQLTGISGGGGGTPGGSNTNVQFNDGSAFGGNAQFTYDKVTNTLTAGIVSANTNGTGQNFKVGDDIWIGDINQADTMSFRGQQNAANAYIVFGNADGTKLGRTGTGPLTYGGAFSATGNVTGGNLLTAGLISATGNANVGGSLSVSPYTRNIAVGFPQSYFGSNVSSTPAVVVQHLSSNAYPVIDFWSSANTYLGAMGGSNPQATAVPIGNAMVVYSGAASSSGVALYAVTGNISLSPNSTSNVFVVTSTGANITGAFSATGNVTGGNLSTTGNVTAANVVVGSTITGAQGALVVTASQGSPIHIRNSVGTSYTEIGLYSNANVIVGAVGVANPGTSVYANTGYFWSSNGLILNGNGAANTNRNIFITTSGIVTVPGTTAASNTTTGAMTVSGGVGVAGNIYAGGLVSVTGAITGAAITGTSLTVSTGNVSAGNILNTNANGVGNIGNATVYFNTVFGKATTAQYADLAEMYSADAAYMPGTVLDFGGNQEVTLSTAVASNRVAGVVSTNPAHLMNSVLTGEYPVAVALTGRVPTSVTGTVSKGDMMVSGGNGVAMACSRPEIGTVIGKALENFSGETGVIEIVVGRL